MRIIKPNIHIDNISFFNIFTINSNFDFEKRFLQEVHRWIWAFCSNIDLCGGPLHFLCEINNHNAQCTFSHFNCTIFVWRVERVIILFCYFSCNSSIYILVFNILLLLLLLFYLLILPL